MRPIDRRAFLLSLPALAAAPRMLAQPARPSIPLRVLNHVALQVSDPRRSVEFYQGLFGMPVQARRDGTTLLRIGDGPQFLAVSPSGSAAEPGIQRLGVAPRAFDADRILQTLAAHDVRHVEAGGAGGGEPGLAPMTVRTTRRGSPPDGTLEIQLADPDGIIVQIQDATYCGGTGPLGSVCGAPEPAPGRGLLAVLGLSHFTIGVSNPQRSNQFYQDLFELPVQVLQGRTPALGVGGGPQFLMFSGGGAAANAAPRPARIDHVCLTVGGFDADRILKTLETYGIRPRGENGPAGPLTSYVTLRLENRGGAREGTPELYFTDPDGLRIQLQDTTYCGGAGLLGEICP